MRKSLKKLRDLAAGLVAIVSVGAATKEQIEQDAARRRLDKERTLKESSE